MPLFEIDSFIEVNAEPVIEECIPTAKVMNLNELEKIQFNKGIKYRLDEELREYEDKFESIKLKNKSLIRKIKFFEKLMNNYKCFIEGNKFIEYEDEDLDDWELHDLDENDENLKILKEEIEKYKNIIERIENEKNINIKFMEYFSIKIEEINYKISNIENECEDTEFASNSSQRIEEEISSDSEFASHSND